MPGYELFVRAPAGATIAAAELAAALARHPGVGAEPFVAPGGDPAQPRGADLRLGAGGPAALADAAFALAARLGLTVYDPQLGAVVTEADRARLEDAAAGLLAFEVDTLGLTPSGPLPAAPPPARPRLHLWLLVGAVVLAVLLLGRGCYPS
jgi:hypothetical protein